MKENKVILDQLLLEAQKAAHILFYESKVITKWPEIFLSLQEIDGVEDLVQIAKQEYDARTIASKIQASDIIKRMNSYIQLVPLENSIIPASIYQSLYEERIKCKGDIWIIHKRDRDPFPSNPHAHNYDAGLKLHLGNGYLFHGMKDVGRIKSKDLLAIRNKITGVTLPELEIDKN